MLYYDPSKNPEGGYIDGVPLRDLTDDELAALPQWLRASVEACGFYTTEAPPRPAIDPAVLAPLADADVPLGDLAADLAQPEQVDPGDGVERTAIDASADGTTATLAIEEPSPRRRR